VSEPSPQPNLLGASRTAFTLEFWGLVALTGVGSGLAAGLLMKFLRVIQHAAWSYHSGTFLHAVDQSAMATRVLILTGTGLLVALVLIAMGRVRSVEPSELEATIWFRDGRLPTLGTFIKAIFSMTIVGLGASLGREAAPKQLGALLGGLFAEWRGIGPSQRRLLAACGAGAGIAAVYNVPFGGALFALEVLLGTLSLPLVAPAFLAALLSTATGWLMLPNEPTYHEPAMPLTAGLAVFAFCFAPLAGVGSALFVKLLAFVATLKPKGLVVAPVAIAVFAGLGALAIPYPQLLGNGKDVVQLAALDKIALPTLAALLLLKPLVTAACLGTGAPGGLFTPTMTFGALLGGVCGHFWLMAWPDTPAGAFALVGAGAVLAATTKGPISALVLLLELTRHLDGLMVPLLVAIAGAVVIAHQIDPRSTYTSRLGGRAFLGDGVEAPGGREAVSVAFRYGDLLRIFLSHEKIESVDLVDAAGEIVGVLLRQDVIHPSPRHLPLEIATAIDFLERR
jgi:chloride channel protein, CIC family